MFSFFRPRSVDVPPWCSMEPTAYAAFQKLVLDHFPQTTAEEIFTGSIAFAEPEGMRVIALRDISNILRMLPQQSWKGRFAQFVRDVEELASASPEDLSPDELRRRLHLRILARGTHEDDAMDVEGPMLADDLYSLYVIDFPRSLINVTPFEMIRITGSPDEAFKIAMRNHGTFRPSQTMTSDLGTEKLQWFGDPESLYVATFLFELDRLAPISEHGALVIVPSAHMLGLVNIESQAAIDTLWLLPTTAQSLFGRLPHPCSRSMYWWRPGKIERIPEPVDDDIESIPGSDEFVTMLRALPQT